jgi:hypothetical protein
MKMTKGLMILGIILIASLSCTLYRSLPDYGAENLEELTYAIYDNIEYLYDVDDEWQYPEETIELGTGDCEDFALLFCAMANDQFGVEPDMSILMYRYPGTNDIYQHAVADLGDMRYDPTWNKVLPIAEDWRDTVNTIPYSQLGLAALIREVEDE